MASIKYKISENLCKDMEIPGNPERKRRFCPLVLCRGVEIYGKYNFGIITLARYNDNGVDSSANSIYNGMIKARLRKEPLL
jgi:hypothetical protein